VFLILISDIDSGNMGLQLSIPASSRSRPPQIRGRRFTTGEDDRIIQYVTECGGHCTNVQWLALEEELGRQNLSSQLRWVNVLKPRLRKALAEQSGAILAGLSTGQSSPVDFELPPKALINTLEYKRHTFSSHEDERILLFSLQRGTVNPTTPWTHLDRELGRNSGACKHRYDTLVARAAKQAVKDLVDEVEANAGKAKTSPGRPYRFRTSPRSPTFKAAEAGPELVRVTDYTPEEDAIISDTVRKSPGRRVTTMGWKALSARLGRPESWLRYRWAILARREENARLVQANFSSLLRAVPLGDSVLKEMSVIVDTLVHTVCSTTSPCAEPVASSPAPAPAAERVAKEVAVPPVSIIPCPIQEVDDAMHNAFVADADPVSFLAALAPSHPSPLPRACTFSELTHIAVQMGKCQEIADDVWLYLSLQLSSPVAAIQAFWQERQQPRGAAATLHPFNFVQQSHIVRVIEDHLAAQKEQAWLRLGQDLRLIPAQVQAIWSQLWFALHFPGHFPSGFVVQTMPSPFFSDFDNAVIVRRMRSSAHDRAIPAWLPDLAVFLCKPLAWVVAQWEVLRQL